MREKYSSPHIYAPDSLASLLLLKKRHPSAVLYAGGTYLRGRQDQGEGVNLEEIIFLGGIDELKRINRTDRYLEIGACVSIASIIATGRRVLPAALLECLENIGNPQVRNLATVGGNICAGADRMDLFPVLALMDVRMEVRRPGGAKWLPLNRCLDENGNFTLNPGEVATRFRIPYEDWTVELYSKGAISKNPDKERFVFCGLAKTQKNGINEIRFIFCLGRQLLLRIRDVELELVGKSLPLSAKTVDLALTEAREYCKGLEDSLPDFGSRRIFSALNLFLKRL